jgi:hypothetical protein
MGRPASLVRGPATTNFLDAVCYRATKSALNAHLSPPDRTRTERPDPRLPGECPEPIWLARESYKRPVNTSNSVAVPDAWPNSRCAPEAAADLLRA